MPCRHFLKPENSSSPTSQSHTSVQPSSPLLQHWLHMCRTDLQKQNLESIALNFIKYNQSKDETTVIFQKLLKRHGFSEKRIKEIWNCYGFQREKDLRISDFGTLRRWIFSLLQPFCLRKSAAFFLLSSLLAFSCTFQATAHHNLVEK